MVYLTHQGFLLVENLLRYRHVDLKIDTLDEKA